MSQLDSQNSPISKYRFCPKCGGSFTHLGGNHLKCQRCSYNYFVNQAPTAGVIIFNDHHEIMLAKRKFEPKKGTWQSVGGFIGLDESFEHALIREAKEELGVDIQLKEYLGSFPETYEFGGVSIPFLAMYFVAKIASGEPQPNDDVEEVRYFSLHELAGLDLTYSDLRQLLTSYIERRK